LDVNVNDLQINVEKGEVYPQTELVEALRAHCILTDYLAPLAVDSKDLGRVGGLPTCPIISIIGM
jgi:hypothetical protein